MNDNLYFSNLITIKTYEYKRRESGTIRTHTYFIERVIGDAYAKGFGDGIIALKRRRASRARKKKRKALKK